MIDPFKLAIVEAVRKVLVSRASVLRRQASTLMTSTTDASGREVVIAAPEAVLMIRNAALFESVAADLDGGAR